MKHADREGFVPGKLWSLWDMLQLKVGRLIELLERLNVEKGWFERTEHEMISAGAGVGPGTATVLYEKSFVKTLLEAVAEIEQIARENSLVSTYQASERTRQFLSQVPVDDPKVEGVRMTAENCGTVFAHLSEIVSRIRDDCRARIYLQMSPDHRALYEPVGPLFGEDVEQKFPIALDDIAEAGKCLAVGQGTATVFHLMRVVEAGLRALAADLSIDYAPSWESYKKKLEKLLDSANHANLTHGQKAKRPFYQDALGDVVAIKTAWRNPTMHIVKSYDVGQAAVIWAATESFMRHIAANLDAPEIAVISTGQAQP
ncbi:hypothetical protein NKJ64_00960 [Mesorhizobium sp. M0062]|uniref:hypothetical protein n=1 Tax=Mesorhizobium sp. M0062 TaxID=2956867 RepID=UPI00333BE48F